MDSMILFYTGYKLFKTKIDHLDVRSQRKYDEILKTMIDAI